MALKRIVVDRASPVPLYFQAAHALEIAIDRGDLQPGDLIPNEIDFAQSLGLSRPTVRHAIDLLVKKGILVRKRGVGTRVMAAELRRRVELTSLYEDLAEGGRRPRSDVLHFRAPDQEPRAARALGLEESAPLVFCERVRYADDRPIAILRNWLVPMHPPLTREELEADSLYRLMDERGCRPTMAKQRITARLATQREARILHAGKNVPLVQMERTAFVSDGSVEYAENVYLADSYAIEVTVFDR